MGLSLKLDRKRLVSSFLHMYCDWSFYTGSIWVWNAVLIILAGEWVVFGGDRNALP